MNDKTLGPDFESLERQYGIPPDKYCGLTPEDMSRLNSPRKPGKSSRETTPTAMQSEWATQTH